MSSVTQPGSEGPSGHNRPPIPAEHPPESVVGKARAAFGESAPELAALIYDSLVDSDDEPEDHELVFRHPRMELALHVSAHPDGSGIEGRVSFPATKVALHVRDAGLAMVSELQGGTFGFNRVPHGLVRLSVEGLEPGSAIWTDWFRV